MQPAQHRNIGETQDLFDVNERFVSSFSQVAFASHFLTIGFVNVGKVEKCLLYKMKSESRTTSSFTITISDEPEMCSFVSVIVMGNQQVQHSTCFYLRMSTITNQYNLLENDRRGVLIHTLKNRHCSQASHIYLCKAIREAFYRNLKYSRDVLSC